MPGYDRTGPMGAGAKTGRGLGVCNRPAGESAPMEDPKQDYAAGRGDRPWGGGRARRLRGGGGGRGRGRGQGRGRAEGPNQNLADFEAPSSRDNTFLMRQVAALTEQLIELKRRVSKEAPASGEDQGT